MKLRTPARFLTPFVLVALALFSGVATAGQLEALRAHVPDKVDFDPAQSASIKKIAILHINAPHHFVIENSSPLAAAFPGFVELAIEGDANQRHTTQYLESVKSKSVTFAPGLAAALQRELQNAGYEVSYLSQGPRLKEDKKTLDYSNIKSDADALMTVWFGKTGYWAPISKADYSPQMILGVKLTDAHTFQTIFFKTFDVTPVAGQVTNDNVEAMLPDAKYLYSNFDDLMNRFDESVQGLQASEDLIAVHVAQRLKPAAQ